MVRDFSFSKATAEQQLSNAREKTDKYKLDPLNTTLADKVAIEVWKCVDYFHRERICGCRDLELRDCQGEIRTKCKAFAAINDVADSAKHAGIDRKTVYLKSNGKKTGDWAREDFNYNDFDTPGLIVKYLDGTNIDFESIVDDAINYLERRINRFKA